MANVKRVGMFLKQNLSVEELEYLDYLIRENRRCEKSLSDPSLQSGSMINLFKLDQLSIYLLNVKKAGMEIIDRLEERTVGNVRKDIIDLLHKGENINVSKEDY